MSLLALQTSISEVPPASPPPAPPPSGAERGQRGHAGKRGPGGGEEERLRLWS